MRRLKNPSVEEILDESVPIPFSGCWIFNRAINSDGYGRFKSGGVSYLAHRYVWQKVNGEIPRGMLICHTCDTPGCVNPDHLFLGTPKENYDDMVRKGRSPELGPPTSGRFMPGHKRTPDRRGIHHPNAKVTDKIVLLIRASDKSSLTLARELNLSPGGVRKIRNRQRWAHL